jgi:hypothetical protein
MIVYTTLNMAVQPSHEYKGRMMGKTSGEIAKEFIELQFSDEEERKNRIKDELFRKLEAQVKMVTPELFARFLDERGASRTCISCGSNKLSVPEITTISGL